MQERLLNKTIFCAGKMKGGDTMNINYIAVIAAAIINMIVGSLWYSPLLFGRQWMKLSGITKEAMEAGKKGMSKKYLWSFIGALVMALVLARIVDYAGAATLARGALIGFWIWLGFIATTTLNSVLWSGKPLKLYVLENAHHLISLIIMGAVIAAWQ